MKVEKKRLFVGNLPASSTEDVLSKKFKECGEVLSVELKRRADGSTFAFLDIEAIRKDLDLRLNKLQQEPWDGHKIKVELAKESFLSKLQRERELSKNNSGPSPRESKPLLKQENKSTYESSVSVAKTFNSSEEPIEENERGKWEPSKVLNNKSSYFSRENGRKARNKDLKLSRRKHFDSSGEDGGKEEERKGNIPMFRGILSVDVDNTEVGNTTSETDLLQRFESFSDMWKDDPYDQNHKIKQNKNLHYSEMSQQTFGPKKPTEIPGEFEKHRKTVAEERRLKSIAERKKSFLQRKQTIRSALMKIDTSVRNSKKIILDPDDNVDDAASYSKQVAVRTPESSSKKEQLFSEDESEGENNDFKIKSQFEGQKGQKLLALQARYANDKRFTLDERFYESDDNAEEANLEREEPTDEKKKQLEILGNILGQELITSVDKNVNQKRKSMLRFDPTKPDHVKYEVKQTPKEAKIRESRLDERIEKKAMPDKVTTMEIIPSVSKDKYYEVSDTLKETLKTKNDKFSLLDMFGSGDLKAGEETYEEEVKGPKSKKQIGWSSNPFKYDSSESEEEEEQKPNLVDKTLPNHQSVWHEPFFFTPNDDRLQRGVQFLLCKNENDEDFAAKRRELKQIIRSKVRNNQKKKLMWKKKLGGKRQLKKHPYKNRKQKFK